MKINATLHCHGPWTDMASGKHNIENFPRDPEAVADLALSKGLDLVGLTDISGAHVCEIYRPLVEKKGKGDRYEISPGETSTVLMRKEDGREVVFARTLEVLSEDAHALIVGTDKNILGARPLGEVVEESYEVGGRVIADHPCYTIKLGKGMGADRVRELQSRGRVIAVEVNANITRLLEDLGKYNQKAIDLGRELNIPAIANCDGNTARDMGRMFTTYDLGEGITPEQRYDAIVNLISSVGFDDQRITRNGTPKPFVSLPLHVVRGFYSIFRAKRGWIEKGLPAC